MHFVWGFNLCNIASPYQFHAESGVPDLIPLNKRASAVVGQDYIHLSLISSTQLKKTLATD